MERTPQANMFYNAKPKIFENAKELRNNLTEAEKILWERLKNNQLGVRFKCQHPIDIFIADFYCHKHKLVIEIDGEIHEFQKEYDKGRTAELEKYDLRIIRFSNEEIVQNIDVVIHKIKEAINYP